MLNGTIVLWSSKMKTTSINYPNAGKRPHYQVNHLKRRSLVTGNIFNERLSSAASSASASSTTVKTDHKGCKEKFDMYLKSYCDMTSLHGLRYFAESGRPWYERCFWLFVICLVVYGMITTIHSQIINYVSNPILMTLNSKVTPVYDVPFPAITICSENQGRPSLINITNLVLESKERNLTFEELSNLEILKMLCTDVNSKPLKLPLNDSYLNGFNNFGFLYSIKMCDKMLKRLVWEGNNQENPCSLVQVSATFLGFCHSFNMIPPHSLYSEMALRDFVDSQPLNTMLQYPYKFASKQSSWSPDTGYVVDTNKSGHEVVLPFRIHTGSYINSANIILDFGVDDVQEQCMPRSNGFLVIIHSPNESPSLEHTLTYVEVDTRTVIHITPQLTSTDEGLRDWLPEERGCYYNHERQLMYFATYTAHNCNMECEANYTLNLCNCTIFFQPHLYTTPLCGLDKYDCYRRSTVLSSSHTGFRGALYSACNCLPACNEIEYGIQITTQPRNWTYNSMFYGIPENETKRDNFANILALYRYKQVNSIVRVAIVSASDFIANIGGLMGLFLGFSFVSIFEVLYFSTIRWMTDVHKRNKWFKKWRKATQKVTSITKVVAAVNTRDNTAQYWQKTGTKNNIKNINYNNDNLQWFLPSNNKNLKTKPSQLIGSLKHPPLPLKVGYYD